MMKQPEDWPWWCGGVVAAALEQRSRPGEPPSGEELPVSGTKDELMFVFSVNVGIPHRASVRAWKQLLILIVLKAGYTRPQTRWRHREREKIKTTKHLHARNNRGWRVKLPPTTCTGGEGGEAPPAHRPPRRGGGRGGGGKETYRSGREEEMTAPQGACSTSCLAP